MDTRVRAETDVGARRADHGYYPSASCHSLLNLGATVSEYVKQVKPWTGRHPYLVAGVLPTRPLVLTTV